MKQVALPFPYRGVVRLRGGRTQTRSLYGWAEGSVPVVDPAEAPVVLRATGVRASRDRAPRDVGWRSWGGAYWRPVLDEAGVPQMVDAEEFFAEPPMSPRVDRWTDHPCGLRLGVRFVEGPDARGWWPTQTAEFLERYDRVVGGNREEAAAAVATIASDDLAEIDGVLHKRAALPMWSLGWDTDVEAYDGRVALVIPDFGEGAPPSLGLVPVTHHGVARELAGRLARGVRAQHISNRPEPGPISLPPLEGQAAILAPVSGGEAIARSMVHAMAMLGRLMETSGYRPAGETRDALIELGLRVGELEYALNAGDFQFLSRGEAYQAIEQAHDALVYEEAVRRATVAGYPLPVPGEVSVEVSVGVPVEVSVQASMACILGTVIECGRLCGDRAAMMVGDDEEDAFHPGP